jgi:hypothetical protein
LFDVYANLLRLRNNPSFLSAFTGNNYTLDLAGSFKTMQVSSDSLKMVVIGNFDMAAKSANVSFPANGTWYSYLTKTSINVVGGSSTINLQPGEYHVYLNRDLSNTVVTGIFSPRIPENDLAASIFPNPVNREFNLSYTLRNAGLVTISILNTNGTNLGVLFKGIQASGIHRKNFSNQEWHAKMNAGGTYFVNIQTPSGQSTLRFVKGL